MSHIPIYEIRVPEYEFKGAKPDFPSCAVPIVKWLSKHFPGKMVGLRLLASTEHPGKSSDELVEIIKKLGHDRYDSTRKGDRYENISNKEIEIFALEIEVGKQLGDDGEEQIGHALNSFYSYPPREGRPPVRVDIGIVYDLSQLESVEHRYKGRENEIKTDGYVFKNPDVKSKAVLAILKIL